MSFLRSTFLLAAFYHVSSFKVEEEDRTSGYILDSLTVKPHAVFSLENACNSGCSVFTDGCNECTCSPEGKFLCTTRMCIWQGIPGCLDKKQPSCPEGCDHYYDGCNICERTDDGFCSCTEKFCAGDEGTPTCVKPSSPIVCNLPPEGKPVVLDDVSINSVDDTSNPDSGTVAEEKQNINNPIDSIASSDSDLKEHEDDEFPRLKESCLKGCKTFYDGCNHCKCLPNGDAMCTKMMCIALYNPNNKPKCTEWHEGKPEIKPTESEIKYPTIEDACASGCKSFFDGCNSCQCSQNGAHACTLKYCLGGIDPKNPPRCTDNENSGRHRVPGQQSPSSHTHAGDRLKNLEIVAESLESNDQDDKFANNSPPGLDAACNSGCYKFYDGCNTCICGITSNDHMCTEMMCAMVVREGNEAKCLETKEEHLARNEQLSNTTTTDQSNLRGIIRH